MSLRIAVDEHAGGLVFSGQELKGTLHVTTTSVLTFTSVSILLRGTSKTKFTRTKIEFGAHHGKIGVKPKVETFEQRILLLNTIFRMVRSIDGQIMQLDPGTHEFPFRFTLPYQLPPSANPAYGCRIRYRLKALVERPELLKMNLKSMYELKVGGYETGAPAVHALLHSTRCMTAHQSGARKYLGNTGNLVAKLIVNNPCVRMDQPFHVKVHISNQTSGQTVSAVRLHLIETYQVFAEGESDSSTRENSWSKTPVDISPGGNCSLNFTPKIGDKWKVCPSVASTLICIRHTLELQVCVASKFSIDLRVRLPIRLFHDDSWNPTAAPPLPPSASIQSSVSIRSAISPTVHAIAASSLSSHSLAPNADAATPSTTFATEMLLSNGSSYSGEVLRGKPHGQGILTCKTHQFVGLFQNGDAVDGVQLDNESESDPIAAQPELHAAAIATTVKYDGGALVQHLLQICPSCNLPPPPALQPVIGPGWNGTCDTSAWVHTINSRQSVDEFSQKPLLSFLCQYCPVFDAAIFHAAFDHFGLSSSQKLVDDASEQEALEYFVASGVLLSIGTSSINFYCVTVNLDEAETGIIAGSQPRFITDRHYDIDPGSADASEADVFSQSTADYADENFETPLVPDAVVAIAGATLICLHNLSRLIMRSLPATIAALPDPWSVLAEQASGISGDADLFAKFLCTLAQLLPLLSSRRDILANIAKSLDESFDTCVALLFCGLPSVSMNILLPLATAVMADSCNVDNSARLCLLSLGVHALILNGCLADALTMLKCAKLLNDTLPDDSLCQSKWLFAIALHQERKVFQDYAGCEEVASRCLAQKSLHPHARILVSLIQLSVKPVMLKLSGSTGVSRSFSWPVHLQLIDKFSLPIPLLLVYECCSSQFIEQIPTSAPDFHFYQEKCVQIVAACFSLRLPKIAVAALFNLKAAWIHEHAVCARILASIVDVCRTLEFQSVLLQAYDAFVFFSRRNQILHGCVVSVCNATNDLDALVFNSTSYVGSRMARLVSLSSFHRSDGSKVQSSMLCEQALQLWIGTGGDHCATLLQCKLIHSCVTLLCATSTSSKALQLVKTVLCFVQTHHEIQSVDPSLQVWLLQNVGRMHRDRKELSIALSFFRRARECAAEILSASSAPADVEVEGPSVPDFFSDDADAENFVDATASAAVDAFKFRNAQFQAMQDQVLAAAWWSRYFAALCLRKLGNVAEANSELNQVAFDVRNRIGLDQNPELLPSSSCKGNTSSNEYAIWNLLGVVSGFLGSIMPVTPSQSQEAVQLLTFASRVATALGQKDQAARWLSLIKASKARDKMSLAELGRATQALQPAALVDTSTGSSAGAIVGNSSGNSSGLSIDGVAASTSRPAAPRAWMRDDDAPCCCICNVTFSFFRRRHHCRICLRVICGDCCKKEQLAPDLNGAAVASAEAVLCCSECSKLRLQ